ncbi:hypothetical protein M427DRAFT_33439, partial [Gonapodya prolifera JEL478]
MGSAASAIALSHSADFDAPTSAPSFAFPPSLLPHRSHTRGTDTMRTNRAWMLMVLAVLGLVMLGARVSAQLDDDDDTPSDSSSSSYSSSSSSADVPFGEDAPRSFTRNPDLEFYSEFPNNPFNALIAYERTPLLINITNLHESKSYRVAAAWGHLVNPGNFSQIVRN